jgi:ferric-chelate reductase
MFFCRYDSLLLIAGGIGITPFLSILQEIASAQNSSGHDIPTRMQLIFVVKKSQDIYLLNSISSLLQNHSSEGLHLKLKIFVTQEGQSNTTVREFLSDSSQLQTVHLSTKCSNHAIYGIESFLRIAALAGFCCIMFLVSLICLNHIFVPTQKKTSKASKETTPSWVVDLLLLSSFLIALTCSSLLAIILRRRRLKNENIPPVSHNTSKAMDTETGSSLEEHEIHLGGRPDFHGTFMYSFFHAFTLYSQD